MRGLTLGDPALLGAAAGFSPLSLSPALWLDASDAATITSSGGKVSQWNDKSGNGINFAQSTSTAQPTTGTTTQNGLNVIAYDGNDSLIGGTTSSFNFMHDGTPHLVAFVALNTAATSIYIGNMEGGGGQRGVYIARVPTAKLSHQVRSLATVNILNNSADNLIGNGAEVVTLTADADSSPVSTRSSIFRRGQTAVTNNIQTGAASTSNATELMRIGAGAIFGTSSFPINGWIAEVIMVAGANATEANRVALRDYLNTKWAVY